MNKSLVLLLLFASITSAYAESTTLDKSTHAMQKDGLIADASEEQNVNALIMEPIAVHPIVVEQTKTTAEQLAEAAYDAIASNKTPDIKRSQVAKAATDTSTNNSESVSATQIADSRSAASAAAIQTASDKTIAASVATKPASTAVASGKASPMSAHRLALSDKKALSMNMAEENLAATSQALDVAQVQPEKPASGSIAEAVTIATKKVALDKMLYEQINIATVASEKTVSTASLAKSTAHEVVLEEKVVTANNPAPISLAKAPTPVALTLDKPLLEQIDKVMTPPVKAMPVASADKPPAPKIVVEEKLAQVSQTWNVAPQGSEKPAGKPAPGFVAAPLDRSIPTAAPKVVAEIKADKTAHTLHAENAVPTKITLDQSQLQQANGASVEAVLKPVSVSTTLKAQNTNSKVVRDEFFEKALPEQVNVAKAAKEKGALNLTPAIVTLTETRVPLKLVQNEKNALKSTQLAKSEPAKAVAKKPAPGSLASAAPSQIALDKTLLQQINTASVVPTKSAIKPAVTAMLAENTPSPEMALENGLRQNEPVKSISGLSTLPVVPVGRMTAVKAQPTMSKPAPGSLGAHAVPVEKMMADNVSSALVEAAAVAPPTLAKNEPAPRGVATDLSGKTNLDKSLLESITAPTMAEAKISDVPLASSAMLAMEKPSNAAPTDGTLLDQIPSAKIESMLAPKKPNNFNTAMIERVTGFKGVFNSKDNIYKISVPRNDLNIVVNGVKLTSAMGLTSWVAFKNTPDFTAVKGNLVLTEEQVNSVMFTAIENNLNVTELHSHYLWESPKVVFMHIEGEGDTKKLALAVNKVFAKIKETSQGNGDFPIAVIDTANSTLSPKKIEMILGSKGALTEGVYKIRVAKMAKSSALISADPAQGANASATFAGSDDEAVLDGDIAMQPPQLQKVLFALHKAGISIVAINQRLINDKTRYVFLHYWGVGKTAELAHGLRAALDASVSDS
jgi:hypothetical protein